MKLNDLVQHISHTGASETDITAITYDSRKACAGSLFVCLVGAWLDGHTYAESAYQNGCRAFWWSIGSTCPRTPCRSSPTTPARRWPSSVRISTATPLTSCTSSALRAQRARRPPPC
ncbi:Mur ligase domain-containing protein [Gemmiger formicilis]|nr:Mur ligase domain-containing protein [Gemmiger formicilis]